jgi:hypothetical protein
MEAVALFALKLLHVEEFYYRCSFNILNLLYFIYY